MAAGAIQLMAQAVAMQHSNSVQKTILPQDAGAFFRRLR